MGDGVDDDLDIVSVWWNRISAAIPSEARGLWFGLFEESTGTSIETGGHFTMYVTGSRSFDADDGGDWATDHVWVPDDRRARSCSPSWVRHRPCLQRAMNGSDFLVSPTFTNRNDVLTVVPEHVLAAVN